MVNIDGPSGEIIVGPSDIPNILMFLALGVTHAHSFLVVRCHCVVLSAI
jgi:hypothetical protein